MRNENNPKINVQSRSGVYRSDRPMEQLNSQSGEHFLCSYLMFVVLSLKIIFFALEIGLVILFGYVLNFGLLSSDPLASVGLSDFLALDV